MQGLPPGLAVGCQLQLIAFGWKPSDLSEGTSRSPGAGLQPRLSYAARAARVPAQRHEFAPGQAPPTARDSPGVPVPPFDETSAKLCYALTAAASRCRAGSSLCGGLRVNAASTLCHLAPKHSHETTAAARLHPCSDRQAAFRRPVECCDCARLLRSTCAGHDARAACGSLPLLRLALQHWLLPRHARKSSISSTSSAVTNGGEHLAAPCKILPISERTRGIVPIHSNGQDCSGAPASVGSSTGGKATSGSRLRSRLGRADRARARRYPTLWYVPHCESRAENVANFPMPGGSSGSAWRDAAQW